ncbi:MAG: helix-turn-helix transcriptional regulator [Bacteroidales bacterium]|nr:helix-turn-helix transcriptional regulator [Bacteroidales bacterium]
MPIIVKLDKILSKRKMTLTELSEKVDITIANLSILKSGKAKAIRFSTLNSICRELNCKPGEIIDYIYDED